MRGGAFASWKAQPKRNHRADTEGPSHGSVPEISTASTLLAVDWTQFLHLPWSWRMRVTVHSQVSPLDGTAEKLWAISQDYGGKSPGPLEGRGAAEHHKRAAVSPQGVCGLEKDTSEL